MSPKSEPKVAEGPSELRVRAAVERTPWWARLRRLPWLNLALALALLAKLQVCQQSQEERDCRRAAKEASNAVAVLICQAEYARERDPQVGAILATVLRRSGDWQGATKLANELLDTPARADALWVLGRVARDHNRYDEAKQYIEDAAKLHLHQQQWGPAAKDYYSLASVRNLQGDFAKAIFAITQSLRYARLANDREQEGLAFVIAARILLTVGHHAGARAQAQQAVNFVTEGPQVFWPVAELGNAYQEMGAFHRAQVAFEQALGMALEVHDASAIESVHLDLTDVMTETGQLLQARQHLAAAAALDPSDRMKVERLALEGRIYAKEGNLAEATRLLEQARGLVRLEDLDEVHDIEESLAALALQQGHLEDAERWARSALVRIDRLHGYRPPPLFGALAVNMHRESYELLFAALARAGKAEAALRAIHHWRAQALFSHLAPRASSEATLEAALREVSALQAAAADLEASAARARDAPAGSASELPLLALVVARGDLWRLVAQGGRVELTNLGPLAQLAPALLEPFRARPTERELARRVGQVLLPPALAQRSQEPLRLFVDDALTALPLEAMRTSEGTPLAALRPLLRTLLPLDGTCTPAAALGRAAVIADPFGDLPAARAEALRLAPALGATAQLAAEASVAAVYQARDADFLHLAVHGDTDEIGGLLRLHDGALRSAELVAHRQAPSRVVLATCATATADRGYYSMATAYLAAGADQVIATLRPVSDQGAAQLLALLYRSGVPADLPRALAAAQAQLATTANTDWPHFVALGRPSCTAPSSPNNANAR